MSEQPVLTSSQIFLLGWLFPKMGQYGECRGSDLDRLLQLGFAEHVDPNNVSDWSWVRLTEKGIEHLRNLK